MHKSKRNFGKEGFTLIEIMVVLGIIGTILALSFQAYVKSAAQSRVASVIGTAKQLNAAITTYVNTPGGLGTIPYTQSMPAVNGLNYPLFYEFTNNGYSLPDFFPTQHSEAEGKTVTLDGMLLSAGILQQPINVKMGGPMLPNNPQGDGPVWSTATNMFVGDGTLPTVDYSVCTHAECSTVDITATPASPNVGAGTGGINFWLDGSTSLPAGTRCAYLKIMNVPEQDAYNLAFNVDGPSMTAPITASQLKGPVVFNLNGNGDGTTTVWYYITNL